MKRTRLLAFTIGTVLMAGTAVAGSFIVPSDDDLSRDADVIVTGVVVASHFEPLPDGAVETIYRIAVDETLKGPSTDLIEFREWGGMREGLGYLSSGTPIYAMGERYLIFLRRDERKLSTLHMLLGQFRFDGPRLVRDESRIFGWTLDGQPYEEPLRESNRVLATIRSQVADEQNLPSLNLRSAPLRPQVNNMDHAAAASAGADSWNLGIVNFSVSGTPAGGDTVNLNDGEERIIIDDPHDEIAGTFGGSGTVAIAKFVFGSSSIATNRYNIFEGDIIIQDGVSSSNVGQAIYASIMSHEMGHTLGFRHSNEECPSDPVCTTNAIMNATVSIPNAVLAAWDQAAVTGNYTSSSSFDPDYLLVAVGGAGAKPLRRDSPDALWFIAAPASCTGPTITAQPTANPTSITSGASSTLSISATDFTSISWFRGSVGTTTSPAGDGTSITVSPTTTTSYWARVTNACTSVNSNAVTVNVTAGCTNVAISTQPASRTIEYGTTTFLSVSATGTSPTYQWFVGNSGDTSNPIAGATSSQISVRPLTTTNYWVQVSNTCPSSVNSTTATVTVLDCQPARITSQPPDQTVESGQRATLSVSVSGSSTFTFRWYQGTAPNTANLVSSSQSFLTPPLTQQTSYWVRVSNDCGTDDSGTVTISIVAACEAPVITQQPQSTSVQAGGSATLSVMATGTALQYQWLEINGTTQTPISGAMGATFTTPALTSTKSYAVRVSNSCGTRTSNTVTVTVTQCQRPMITQQPQDITISRGAGFTLTVTATGEGFLQYQWYRGQSGDTSNPISGGVGPGLFIGTLDTTTSYWVQVTNGCGSTNSATATVSISPRRRATVHR